MKPEDFKKLDEKLKKSDNVKIKLMKVYPVPGHQLIKEDANDINLGIVRPSKDGSTVLKELEFKTDAYPLLEITNFDMCSNMDETVDLTMSFRFFISKKKLFELMAALHTSDMLWYDDNFPVTVKLTAEPNIDGFHWKKEKKSESKKTL